MASGSYFDRIMPRRSLRECSILSSTNDGPSYSSFPRRLRQHHFRDTKFSTGKVFSSSSPPSVQQLPSSSLPAMTTEASSERVRERTGSATRSSSRSQLPPSQYQSSIDLMAASLKCDDCQTNDGLFQCCHCNQRLCIRCCNKHYKKVTLELERLHELSDRLVAKIVHTKNDLERQKNETLEQCHKWRVDTINTINKAHALIVQTIHDEYEILGKEYEVYVQKEMARIHVDQNELTRMRKGNLGNLLSSASSAGTDATNSIDTIRKRIENFAKNIDETGKFLFQVQLPTFDIDDRFRVDSRFGDVTRSTSATWLNGHDVPSPTLPAEHTQVDQSLIDTQSTETDVLLNNNDVTFHMNDNDEIEELPDKTDEHEFDNQSQTTTTTTTSSISPAKSEIEDSHSPPLSSSRYALSVENDIELQQQQFYSPTFRGDRYDSAYGTAPSSPSSSLNNNHHDHYSSTSSLHESSSKRFSYPTNAEFGSFYNNRRHTHAFHRTSSPTFHNHQRNDDDDSYRSVQHVELKCEQDGSLEGVAVQIEQSHTNDGRIESRRTCMQACGVRRRTMNYPSKSYSSNTEGLSHDHPWFYQHAYSTPSFP